MGGEKIEEEGNVLRLENEKRKRIEKLLISL